MDLLSPLHYDEFIRDFWRQWFTVEAPLGREIFQRNNRVWTNSFTDFQKYVLECKKSGSPCWLTVQPFRQQDQPAMVEKLYFDFDSENLCEAWREASAFASSVKQFYDAEPLICFSGNKGYNVYVWLQSPVKLQDGLKRFCKTAQNMLFKGLKFKTLDPQVLGDVKRFSRVPYSIHQETKNPCVPINSNHNPVLITDLTSYRRHGLNSKFVDLCLIQLEGETRLKRLKLFRESDEVRPCIKAALNQPLEGGSGHLMRLAAAVELSARGCTVDEIVSFFQNQADFSPDRCRYFIEHAKNRGYKPFKCKTIRKLGFCLPGCPMKKNP